MKFSAPYKGCTARSVSQGWHAEHKALDIISYTANQGRGTPLTAPEDAMVIRIAGETLTHDNEALKNGYGIFLRGLESGKVHMLWHGYPVFPVNVGEKVKRGQIVSFMSNSGTVRYGGVYVPLETRLKTDAGTHLHWEVMDDYNVQTRKKFGLYNFTAEVDWNLQPNYNWMEHKLAILKTVLKAKKLLGE